MFDLKTFIRDQRISQIELANKLGYTESYISRIFNGETPLNAKFIDRLNRAFPNFVINVNNDYQITDIISLNLPDNQVQEPGTFNQYSDSSLIKQVPFSEFMETQYLSIEAQAGYLDSLESQEIPKLETMLIPQEFEKGNYLVIEIKGDSMNDGTSRSIQDGDKLLCKELQKHHWTNKLHFNQYLFVIASPG
ncbi:MAG: hypothetical protein RI952_1537 [Bacteroidota bacterium]|jgi:transcriptional regulator with XRE-family HTH domain